MPFIAWSPGKIQAGTTDHIAAFWDFLPTACDMADIETPEGLDGISYLPALFDKKQEKHDYLYWEFHEQGGKQAIRKGDWKAIRLQVAKVPVPVTELYNLADDQGEENNVADKYPEIVKEMNDIFAIARTSNPDWPLLASEKK